MNPNRDFDTNKDLNPSITPIKQNEEAKTIPINTTNINTTTNTQDDFIKTLPNWDLTPPYEEIRRITRI